MDEQTKQNYIKAGQIASQALQYGKTLIKKGNSMIDTLDKIEQKIHELGARPAFPAQIASNHIAAHFCPESPEDDLIFDDQLLCLDIGVHIDGCVGDNALTVDLSGQYTDLVTASRKALNEAIAIMQQGTKLCDIGKTIQETIASYGFAPIRNLSGHGLDKYIVHTSPTVPNYDNGDTATLENGMTFAIEPFATTGKGIVDEAGTPTIFSLQNKKPVRLPIARTLLKDIEQFSNLPFTSRWLFAKHGPQTKLGLRELMQRGVLRGYPPLVEIQKGMVSQAEHSILIDDGKAVILTEVK